MAPTGGYIKFRGKSVVQSRAVESADARAAARRCSPSRTDRLGAMDAAASGRGRPLTPQMQQEVNAIVFQPKRVQLPSMSPPAAAPPAAAASGYLVSALTEDPMLVNPARAFAGKDSEDHFGDVDIRETWAMSFDRVYDSRFVNEDTRDHFGVGMNMADDNDTSMAFDRVYDSRFVEKDTEDHFEGMVMGGDEATEAMDAHRKNQLEKYYAARADLQAQMAAPEELHMGHEQLDTKTHFEGQSLNMQAGTDASVDVISTPATTPRVDPGAMMGPTGEPLTTAKVFRSLAFINILRFPLNLLSQACELLLTSLSASTRSSRPKSVLTWPTSYPHPRSL